MLKSARFAVLATAALAALGACAVQSNPQPVAASLTAQMLEVQFGNAELCTLPKPATGAWAGPMQDCASGWSAVVQVDPRTNLARRVALSLVTAIDGLAPPQEVGMVTLTDPRGHRTVQFAFPISGGPGF